MNELPKELISEGIGEIYYLMPIPFIAIVISIAIWWQIVRLDGTTLKGYRFYNIGIAIALAFIAHFTVPVDELQVNDIPTLILSIVFSGFFIEIFLYWRKKKSKKL